MELVKVKAYDFCILDSTLHSTDDDQGPYRDLDDDNDKTEMIYLLTIFSFYYVLLTHFAKIQSTRIVQLKVPLKSHRENKCRALTNKLVFILRVNESIKNLNLWSLPPVCVYTE